MDEFYCKVNEAPKKDRIAKYLTDFVIPKSRYTDKHAGQILALIYRKIEEKPPILSAEQRSKICKAICEAKGCNCDVGCQEEIAQAQRGADVKFYDDILAR